MSDVSGGLERWQSLLNVYSIPLKGKLIFSRSDNHEILFVQLLINYREIQMPNYLLLLAQKDEWEHCSDYHYPS